MTIFATQITETLLVKLMFSLVSTGDIDSLFPVHSERLGVGYAESLAVY